MVAREGVVSLLPVPPATGVLAPDIPMPGSSGVTAILGLGLWERYMRTYGPAAKL